MQTCFNKRVLIGVGVLALGMLAVSPRLFGAILPLLFMAACPLSMLLMMRDKERGGQSSCGGGQQPRDGAQEVQSGAGGPDRAAEIRELEEEVNRLRAELRLREGEPKA